MYQLQRHGDVSAWSGAFRLVAKMGQFLLHTISVNFLGVSGGSVSLRHQLVRCYNVSKTSVSFRYQLRRLCDVVSRSVSLSYQLLRRYDVSNWLVLFTYQRRLKQVSLIDVPVETTRWRLSTVRNVSTYMRPKWDVATASHAGWVVLQVEKRLKKIVMKKTVIIRKDWDNWKGL